MEANIVKVDNGFEVSYNLGNAASKDVFPDLKSALADVSAKFSPAVGGNDAGSNDAGTGTGAAQ